MLLHSASWNMLYWIDFVSLQFFPSMHPLTRFAIQAWGAEKMRCQNIIICPPPPLPSYQDIIHQGCLRKRISCANVHKVNKCQSRHMFTLIDAKTNFDTFALLYKILKMLQPKELPVHINDEPHPTFDLS